MKNSNAPIAIFFATMLVIHFLSSLVFAYFPHFQVKPKSIVHILIVLPASSRSRVGVTLTVFDGAAQQLLTRVQFTDKLPLLPIGRKRKHLLISYHRPVF